MKNEIISNPGFAVDVASCITKIANENRSVMAFNNARTKAFVDAYMYGTDWKWKFADDIELARGLPFANWLKEVDVREYFKDEKFLGTLLTGMSADELKVFLSDEMREYYDSFREDTEESAHSSSAKDNNESKDEEPEEDDGDEKEDWVSALLDIIKNFAHSENDDNDEKNNDEEDNKEDKDNKEEEGHDENHDKDEDSEDALFYCGDLKDFIDALTEKVSALAKKIDEETKKDTEKEKGKKEKKKNENKGN